MPLILGANSVSGYTVKNSLRFNSGSTDYLNRTFGTSTNTKIFTWSFWVKRTTLGTFQYFFENVGSYGGDYPQGSILFRSDNSFEIYEDTFGGGSGLNIKTNRLFRDVSAWYHIVIGFDSTQATSSNRVKLYVNGTQETSLATATYPSQNHTLPVISGSGNTCNIGKYDNTNSNFNGYLSEVYLIDGQQLDPSSFGETDTDTGIWKPKAYTGTYGTNGFYLKFANSASLGTDSSGNGNNFTVNNLTSIDQTTDTPTNNFATLNPLNTGTGTLSEGNLKWVVSSSTGYLTFGTIAIDMDLSNKFYCEMKLNTSGGIVLGIAPTTLRGSDTDRAGSYGYYNNGDKYSGTTSSSYGASFTTNDIIGMLAGNGTLTFYKNGVSQGTAFSGLTGTYIPFLSEVSCDVSMNFGNPPFTISSSETDPSGFGNFEYSTNNGYALNTKNLAQFG